jgi:hypothetical protein
VEVVLRPSTAVPENTMVDLEIPSDPFLSDLRRLAHAASAEAAYRAFREHVRR